MYYLNLTVSWYVLRLLDSAEEDSNKISYLKQKLQEEKDARAIEQYELKEEVSTMVQEQQKTREEIETVYNIFFSYFVSNLLHYLSFII